MISFLLFLLFVISVFVGSCVCYSLYCGQKRLEDLITKRQNNNFYLQVEKSTTTQENTKELQREEPDETIVTIDDSNNSGLTYSTKKVSVFEDSREKIVVMINYKQKISETAYRNIDKTFILRKGMDVEEVMDVLGEPEEVDYPNESITSLRYPGASDFDYVEVYIADDGLWKVENFR